jgi:hypothetical protein
VAERDELGSSLRGHDARHLSGRERVALRKRAEALGRLGAHLEEGSSDRSAAGRRLPADVHHPNFARLVDVAQLRH